MAIQKEPQRIAHVIGQMINGGVETVVFNYYKHIDKREFQFDFYYDTDSTIEPSQELLDMGARFYLIPAYKNVFRYMSELTKLFQKNQYRIVHSHMNTLSVFTLRAAKKAGVPVRIAHNHSTAGKGESKRNIMKYMLRPLAKVYPTHLMACSNYAGEWLFGKSFIKKGQVLYNAVDMNKFNYDRDIRERYRKELQIEDKFVIGHVGRFSFQKNHDKLIDIFYECTKSNDDAVLLLIGEGELRKEIEEKVRRLGIVDKVYFMGIRNDVNAVMQAMDVFVLPSRYEGLPVVGVEAQMTGLSCVLSENMTKETKIIESTIFVGEKEDCKYWRNEILKFRNRERQKIERNNNGFSYDIELEGAKLGRYYGGM